MANFETAEISLENRKTSDVLCDHYWGLWYFLFPFYVLTKTENTMLYMFILFIVFLLGVGVFKGILPLVLTAGAWLTTKLSSELA